MAVVLELMRTASVWHAGSPLLAAVEAADIAEEVAARLGATNEVVPHWAAVLCERELEALHSCPASPGRLR